MHAGFAGTDAWEFCEVPATMTQEELDDFTWELAKNHAEMYGIYPREEYVDTEDYNEDDESYSDNIEGHWEDYNPEKHDGHTITGTPLWSHY